MNLDVLAAAEALIARELDRRHRAQAWAEAQSLFAAGEHLRSFEVFCRDMVVITTKVPGEELPLRWSRIQRMFNENRCGQDIVLKCRQIGLTTNELARNLWFALTRRNVAVAVVVQAHKEHEPKKKVCAQLDFMLTHLGIDTGAHWSGPKVTFENGSSITVLDCGGTEEAADKQGRGGTYHRVHLTESAFYKFGAAIIGALLNALPPPEKGGELTEESTPNGAYGRFYGQVKAATAGASGMRLHFFPWMLQAEYTVSDDPAPAEPETPEEEELVRAALAVGVTLTQAQLVWWRRECVRKGHDKTLQEYAHDPRRCFLLPGSSYFDLSSVEKLEARAVLPFAADALPEAIGALAARYNRDFDAPKEATNTHPALTHVALRVWDLPEEGVEYLVVVDTAGGKRRGDWPVALFFRRDTHRHVATLRVKVKPSEFARRVATVAYLYNAAVIVVERNNHGGTVLTELEEHVKYPRIWKDPNGAGDLGWWTGAHNRLQILDDLVDAVTQGTFDTRDALFSAEARQFIRHADGYVGAASGEHDDVVMAAAIARRVLTLPDRVAVEDHYDF